MRLISSWLLCCLVCTVILGLWGCKDKPEAPGTEADAPMPAYLLSHTSGLISRNADIVVTFDTTLTQQGASISLSPSVAGETTLNGRQLIFDPSAPLASGSSYRVTVSASGKPDYQFTLSTPRRELEVVADGIYIPDADKPEEVEITGRVVTNDGATTEEISEVLSIKHRGKPVAYELEQSGNNVFEYVARLTDRGSDPSVATVTYNGDAGAFAGAKGETEVRISPVGTFEVLGVQPSADRSSLTVRFSESIDRSQELNGLLRFNRNVAFTSSVDGNLINIYPNGRGADGEATLIIDPKLASSSGKTLGRSTEWKLQLGRTEPGLRAVGNGTIMPHDGRRLYTFEAVGLDAVYLELFRIHAGNVIQFLQDENLNATSNEWSLRRVGNIIARQEIKLSTLAATGNSNRWTRYAIDLDPFITQDDGAIYQIRLAFGLEHLTAGSCGETLESAGLQSISDRLEQRTSPANLGFASTNSFFGDYNGLYGSYDWSERDNPCSPAFYNYDHFLLQNVVSSNLGLIAKRNPDRSTLVFATNLITAGPQAGVKVAAYSFDDRLLFEGMTDSEGRVSMTTEYEPGFITAELNQDVAYLKLEGTEGLALSRFDVNGTEAAGGIKGQFYAERGVWRPGDSVFLNFILEDREQRLPANYPIEFTLTDARNRTVMRRNLTPAFDSDLYDLTFTTDRSDATGNWTATVKAGGQTYSRSIMVETVKPNRLAIDLNTSNGMLKSNQRELTLEANWLYGAPGAGLRATMTMQPAERDPEFTNFNNFVFQDPARQLNNSEETAIFDGTLNDAGRATVSVPNPAGNLPGPLRLRFSTRVFEPGGNFSIDNQSLDYDPYNVYAGVRLPTDEWGSKSIPTEGSTNVEVSAVDPSGRGVAGRKLSIGIYRVDWRYWWQDSYDNVARFSSSRHTESIKTLSATTDARGRASVPVSIAGWGRYLMRVCDADGHCTGDYFYGGYGDQEESDRESASLLRLSAEEETVNNGEQVSIKVPTSAGGQLLVSLETSVGSIEQFWVPAGGGETTVTFATDERMVPTVYANITYLQPYQQTTNDRPVRLYGVVPIEVVDPETVLDPEIAVASEWKPEQEVEVKVSEANGRPMTYTLAVVDEGLLGLTRFATPNPHEAFFSKEALSVKTYDLYEYVMSSINGEFGKVLAIGGDGTIVAAEAESANRFVPVVRHLGPFQLRGGSRTHRIDLPNYVGAVRVMVVAAGDRAYGSDEARVPVRQPLMVLPTLPRVLGPGERVDMPVNVFAMDNKVKNVNVSVAESEGLVSIDQPKASVTFSGAGDKMTYVPVTVGQRSGIAHFTVTASGNGENSKQDIEIDVRQPNVLTTRTDVVSLAPGESRQIAYTPFGVEGSRRAEMEISGLPAMNLQRHLRYLLSYPYGCLEQTVSPAFAQLYLDKVMELTPAQQSERRNNVTAGLEALRKFKTGSGGMGYWPGQSRVQPWATNYVLHFMLEAERAGFGVPYELKRDVLAFQKRTANSWNRNDGQFYATPEQRTLDQAYRLYGLALAGEADVGAMNRLRGIRNELSATARYQLAAAYALAGRKQTATELISGQAVTVGDYQELGYTFGSEIRDMSIILEAQLTLDEQAAAAEQALRLARAIGGQGWLNTQEAAFAFIALGKLGDSNGNPIKADFTSPSGKSSTIGVSSGVYAIELPTSGNVNYTVKNTGSSTAYVTTITAGRPAAGAEEAVSKGLSLQVAYKDANGNPVNVANLRSGTDFIAEYTVTNPGNSGRSYQQMALATLLPSGWEVSNARLGNEDGDDSGAQYEYQDFRDDRVYTFFDLPRGASKTFSFRMTATYPGRYYLPTQVSEAMYDQDIRSEVKGKWIEVTKS